MQQHRKGGFRRLAVVIAVAAAGVLVVGAHAASAGTLEVCKTGLNGQAGKTFHFTVAPGAVAFNITPAGSGSTCTGPLNIAGVTQATITESDTGGNVSEVASITLNMSSRLVSKDLDAKQITVRLGTTTANETVVTFTNQPSGGNDGVLKVCKLTETPAFAGTSFSFKVNGGSLVSAPANFTGDPNDTTPLQCRILGTFQVGSNVTVQEQIPVGATFKVQFIDSDPVEALFDDASLNLDTGSAKIHVGTGTTIIYYDNEPIPPSGTGFIEVCKNPDLSALPNGHNYNDPDVTGTWHFTITDADGNLVTSRDVDANQCTNAIPVPAGIVRVTETPQAGFKMVDGFSIPSDAFVNSNNINGTVDVEVPASEFESDEVQVIFVNAAIKIELKVCKALGPASSALIGQTFKFNVTDISDPDHEVFLGSVFVKAGASTGCVPFSKTIQIGTVVRVDEVFAADDDPMTPLFDESGQFITTNSPKTTTIGPAGSTANSVTITNTAFGLLEICKDPVAYLNANVQPTFQFKVDNGTTVYSVRPGTCGSRPIKVAPGEHTVTELINPDYEVTAIKVSPSDRLVGTPDLLGRTVKVSVPYAGDTAVTYTNAIRKGQYKICKQIAPGSINSLSNRTYNYTTQTEGPPHTFTPGAASVFVPADDDYECGQFLPEQRVLQADGTRTIVGVMETVLPSFTVTDIKVVSTRGLCSGTAPGGTMPDCIPGGKNLATGNVNFYLAPGPQFVEFTNKSTTAP